MSASRSLSSRHHGKLFGDGGGVGGSSSLGAFPFSSSNGGSSFDSSNKKDGSSSAGASARPDSSALVAALEERLGAEESHELQELFKLVDKDGSRAISQEEFVELLHTLSVRPSPTEMELMYAELDLDGDGFVTYEEFLTFMTSPGIASMDGVEVLHAFQHLEAIQYETGTYHLPPPPAPSRPASTPSNSKSSPSVRTGSTGQLHLNTLSQAFREYLPDKVRSEKEANALLKPLLAAATNLAKAEATSLGLHKRNSSSLGGNIPLPTSSSLALTGKHKGYLNYQTFVQEHVRPESMPPRDEQGNFIFEYKKLRERKKSEEGKEAGARAEAGAATSSGGKSVPQLPLRTKAAPSASAAPSPSASASAVPSSQPSSQRSTTASQRSTRNATPSGSSGRAAAGKGKER